MTLDGPQAHYLANVMRAHRGAPVLLCDDQTGEWLAEVQDTGGKRVTLTIAARTRAREVAPDLWLCAAPTRRTKFDWIAEKATELGIARIVPVRTARSVVDRINPDKARHAMIEAAEQCGRTALPALADMTTVSALLRDWDASRTLLFADEAGGTPIIEAARAAPAPAAFLIGPEGGFTEEERDAIRALPFTRPVSLGPRILRAETAAIAAAAVWMAVHDGAASAVPD